MIPKWQMQQTFPHYFYTSDGTRIFYLTNFDPSSDSPGEKEIVLVFNYGLVCSHQHWENQLSFFDQKGYKIILHDYRGHFSSEYKHIEDCNFANFAQDLAQLLDFFPSPKFFMLGHSMGVNVTLEYALRFPERLVGLVLISGSVLPPQSIMFNSNLMSYIEPFAAKLKKQFPTAFKFFWKNSYMLPLFKDIVHEQGFNTDQVSKDYVETYLKRIGEIPSEMFFQLLKEMFLHNIIDKLPNIKTPTLIISGDKDNIIPHYTQSIFTNQMPNTEFYLIKDGGHVPQSDFPDQTNERIAIFFKKLR